MTLLSKNCPFYPGHFLCQLVWKLSNGNHVCRPHQVTTLQPFIKKNVIRVAASTVTHLKWQYRPVFKCFKSDHFGNIWHFYQKNCPFYQWDNFVTFFVLFSKGLFSNLLILGFYSENWNSFIQGTFYANLCGSWATGIVSADLIKSPPCILLLRRMSEELQLPLKVTV